MKHLLLIITLSVLLVSCQHRQTVSVVHVERRMPSNQTLLLDTPAHSPEATHDAILATCQNPVPIKQRRCIGLTNHFLTHWPRHRYAGSCALFAARACSFLPEPPADIDELDFETHGRIVDLMLTARHFFRIAADMAPNNDRGWITFCRENCAIIEGGVAHMGNLLDYYQAYELRALHFPLSSDITDLEDAIELYEGIERHSPDWFSRFKVADQLDNTRLSLRAHLSAGYR